jgi:hypothetical protein
MKICQEWDQALTLFESPCDVAIHSIATKSEKIKDKRQLPIGQSEVE